MAAPQNIQEYFAKMKVLRDQLMEWKNNLKEEGTDLKDVTKNWLMDAGLSEDGADYEINRLNKAKAVYQALTDFDNASV